MWFPLEQKLTQKKHYETGVGKIRENINNLKNNVPIRNHLLFTSGAGGGGGLLQCYRALEVGGGGKENQPNFIGHNKNCPPPSPS